MLAPPLDVWMNGPQVIVTVPVSVSLSWSVTLGPTVMFIGGRNVVAAASAGTNAAGRTAVTALATLAPAARSGPEAAGLAERARPVTPTTVSAVVTTSSTCLTGFNAIPPSGRESRPG